MRTYKPRPKLKRFCACGCGTEFTASNARQQFVNATHRVRAFQRGQQERRPMTQDNNNPIEIVRMGQRYFVLYDGGAVHGPCSRAQAQAFQQGVTYQNQLAASATLSDEHLVYSRLSGEEMGKQLARGRRAQTEAIRKSWAQRFGEDKAYQMLTAAFAVARRYQVAAAFNAAQQGKNPYADT